MQTYGTLVAADETDLIIRHVAENSAAVLGHEPKALLGQPLSKILAPLQLAELIQARDASEGTFALSALTIAGPDGGGRSLDCLAHRHDGTIVVEMLAPQAENSSEGMRDELRQRLAYELTKPESVEDLTQVGVRLCRLITGYDRVMAYRFHEDLHGEVIAEDTERDDRYLEHFPITLGHIRLRRSSFGILW
ncbi:MAG: hypothetical protein O3A96_02525, partial [Proteobacteria bacterium]|nr:hypothetical protein [Pseudomonadota bacterium]